MVYQAARINQSMKLYKTVATPFGATKRLKKHSVLGTARKMYLDTPELIKFVREHANDYDTLKRKDVPRCLTIKYSRNGRYFSVYIEKFGEISFKEVLNVFPLLPKSYLNE
jgi:hypothetical protein